MKTYYFLLISCGFLLQMRSQNKECDQTTQAIHSFVTENKWTEAYQAWSEARICATANESVLLDAEKILQYKIEAATSDTEKSGTVKELILLYSNYDKKFPGNSNGNLFKKAWLLKNYKLGKDSEIYALLDRAFTTDKANFKDPAALYLYLELFIAKYKAGEKGISEEDIISKFDIISTKLKSARNESAAQTRSLNTALNGAKAIIAPYISCAKLTAFYDKNFETNRENSVWLQQASDNLMDNQCSAGSVFLKIASESYRLNPTPKSAYHSAIANLRNRYPQKAAEYFNISAELETDANEKANTLYAAASAFLTDKPVALAYLKKAVVARPSFGKAYLLMAQLYATEQDCGQTPFEKKAVYFLAAQTAMKAGDADKMMKKAATQQAESYLKQAPSKDEIRQEKKGGKKVTFDCWINESVIIPDA